MLNCPNCKFIKAKLKIEYVYDIKVITLVCSRCNFKGLVDPKSLKLDKDEEVK